MHPAVRRLSTPRLASFFLLTSALILSGCGMTGSSGANQADGGSPGSFSMTGLVHGGQQPITGSAVTVYAAGNTGYGSTATALATTTSDSNGNFAFGAAGGNAIVCPNTSSATESQTLYMIASGGDPTTATPNTKSILMYALGDCNTLENTQPFISINELSTFAGITAMQHFFNPTTESFGTAATNALGLTNAALAAKTLLAGTQIISAPADADASVTGATVTVTPETSKLYLAANVLAACVNTNGAVTGPTSASACYTLFTDVNPAQASDTLQAAYYMASNPTDTIYGTSNIAAVYGLSSSTAPFQTAATTATDWTIGATYVTTSKGSAGGTYYLTQSPQYLAIDADGDVWVANYASTAASSSITEFSTTGAPLKQALTGAFLKASGVAIDPLGDIWIADNGATQLVEYTTAGVTNTYPTTVAPYALTIDGAGDVFEAAKSSTAIQEVPAGTASGTAATTVATLAATTTYPAITIDKNYTLWVATGSTVDQFLYSGGSYGTATAAGTTGGLALPESIAVDPSNNIWAGNYSSSAGSLSELYATNTTSITGPSSAISDTTGMAYLSGVASDSAGNIFTASNTAAGSVVELSSAGAYISPVAGYTHTNYDSESLAIDASGNVWVGSEGTATGTHSNTITEIFGIATPVITPIAANLPAAPPTSTAKSPLVFSSLPTAYEPQGLSFTYPATLAATSGSVNPNTATGTFSLTYVSATNTSGTTLCSIAGPFTPGTQLTCSVTQAIATGLALPVDNYTIYANYSGDAYYAASSTPITLTVEPSTSYTGMIGTAFSGTNILVVGATVTLYSTSNYGVATAQTGGEIDAGYYSGPATVRATGTTNAGGTFVLPAFGCANVDDLYITVSGGQTSGVTSNTNSLLMAALGPCSAPVTTSPIVNEVTTVAAAYTLAGFMSISGTTVNITSSSTNYATPTQSTGTIYHPVGLQHAFLNAANLANVATGQANATLSGYSGTTVPIMPANLINSVANALSACTQTQANCTGTGGVLTAAIPLTTGTATVPTTTLQAALNIARNPFMGGTGNAANWLKLSSEASSGSLFSPVVTPTGGTGTTSSTPHDLSAAIIYPAGLTNSTTSTPLLNLYGVVASLDANDEFYLISEFTSSPYYYGINGFASNGQNVLHHAYCQGSYTYNQSTCLEPLQSGNVQRLAADQLGNLWLAQYGTTAPTTTFASTQSALIQITTTGAIPGAFANIPTATSGQMSTYISPASPPISLAVDQNNDVWLGTTGGIIDEFINTSVTPTTSVAINQTAAGTTMATETADAYSLAFDGQQNLFFPGYSTTAGTNSVWVIPNESLTSTTYPAASTGAIPESFTAQGTTAPHTAALGDYGYSLAFDSAGNVYENAGTSTTAGAAGDGINVISRSYTANAISGLTAASSLINGSAISSSSNLINVALSRPQLMTQDGTGAIFFPDYAVDSLVRLYGSTGTSIQAYYPCIAATCSTIYGSGTNLFAGKQAFVDSTGTVIVFTTTNGNWGQVFGIGTPDFPLAQAGHPAQMP